uniref:hypothetical protein n=1 Tax=Sphingomonas bacterium TaxID=1895847 RepID=UPI0026378EF7|nr:hypothetical protein [Sphingomonas bacterium]
MVGSILIVAIGIIGAAGFAAIAILGVRQIYAPVQDKQTAEKKAIPVEMADPHSKATEADGRTQGAFDAPAPLPASPQPQPLKASASTSAAIAAKPSLNIRVTKVKQSSFNNYSGMVDPPNEQYDGQIISLARMTITNLSRENRVSLEVTLLITASDGTHISLDTLGIGPFGRELGVNDRGTLSLKKYGLSSQSILKAPIEIAPQASVAGGMAFVHLPFDVNDRNQFLRLIVEHKASITLILHDLVSGGEIKIPIEN